MRKSTLHLAAVLREACGKPHLNARHVQPATANAKRDKAERKRQKKARRRGR